MSTLKRFFPWFLAVLFASPASWAFTPTPGSPYEVQLLVDGVPAREYLHGGGNYVLGESGRRYAIRVTNHTGRRVEVVTTVDGLDVVDGKPGDFVHKRGYVLSPWQTYDIEGFRLDFGRVAAFRFASVGESYAAKKGDARNVGVIGVAFFPERERPRPAPRPVVPYSAPADESYDLSRGDAAGAGRAPARAKSGAASAPSVGGGSGGYDLDDVASRSSEQAEAAARPGLGTEFGESRHSRVSQTTFTRASSSRPAATVVLRYNDRDGLLAAGVPLDCPPVADAWTRRTANPFPANPPRHSFAEPPAGWRR